MSNLSEKEKKAIEDIKKDDEYLNILQDIKKNKYNMCNVAKLMKNTIDGNYTEYEIAESIVYFVKLLEKKQKETEKYKRYFKLAISDLQSEGYLQMPYKEIENYYSKRNDKI